MRIALVVLAALTAAPVAAQDFGPYGSIEELEAVAGTGDAAAQSYLGLLRMDLAATAQDSAAATALLRQAHAQGNTAATAGLAALLLAPLYRVSAEPAPGIVVSALSLPVVFAGIDPDDCTGWTGTSLIGETPDWIYTRIDVTRGGQTVHLDPSCLGEPWPASPSALPTVSGDGRTASATIADGASSGYVLWDLRTGSQLYAGPPIELAEALLPVPVFARLSHFIDAATADGPGARGPELLGLERATCPGGRAMESSSFEPGTDEMDPALLAVLTRNLAARCPAPGASARRPCLLVTAGLEPGETDGTLAFDRARSIADAYGESAAVYQVGRPVSTSDVLVYPDPASRADGPTVMTYQVTCPSDG